MALSGFCCPIWLPARLTQLLGKGPCSLPQALHSGPSTTHQEERARRDPLSYLKPTQGPPAQMEHWRGKGLSSPPQVSLARSEVLGAPGWSWGLNPDHKARELTGISGQMLLAKPLGLQGPDRKPSSFPVASLPPSRQPLGFGDCPDRGLLPEVLTSPWEICGHPSRRCSLKGAVISDRNPPPPPPPVAMAGMRRSREAKPGPYLGMHSQPSQDLQEASEQLHGQHLFRRPEPGFFKAQSPCSSPSGRR